MKDQESYDLIIAQLKSDQEAICESFLQFVAEFIASFDDPSANPDNSADAGND